MRVLVLVSVPPNEGLMIPFSGASPPACAAPPPRRQPLPPAPAAVAALASAEEEQLLLLRPQADLAARIEAAPCAARGPGSGLHGPSGEGMCPLSLI